MADINFDCPHCGQNLETDESLSGSGIDCPACKKLLTIPGSAITIDLPPEPTNISTGEKKLGGPKKVQSHGKQAQQGVRLDNLDSVPMHDISKPAGALIEWYWAHGKNRVREEKLFAEGWLAELYKIERNSKKLFNSATQSSRAALALWGPSQAGKSVMLSGYIDGGKDSDPTGKGSALDWGTPVRFSIPYEGYDEARDDTICVNPYNAGMDGSGCITRFTMVNPEETHGMDLEHPVELSLATPSQIMHGLAAGYASECRAEYEGKTANWNMDSLSDLLDKYDLGLPEEVEIDRPAYELLLEVTEILIMLRKAQVDRYMSIPGGSLDSAREKILQCRSLLSSREKVEEFAAELFWNGRSRMTETYKGLCQMIDKVQGYTGGKGNIHCSFKVAHIFLDISRHEKIVDEHYGTPDLKKRLRGEIDALSWKSCEDGIVMTHEEGAGQKMVQGIKEFAYLQGIIWKLLVPLREDRLRENSPTLHELLSKADIVDFPGVSNVGKASELDLIDVDDLPEKNEHWLFTKILKRGRTSSVVASSARDYDLDGFSILVRRDRPTSQPSLLTNGINVWWKAMTTEDIYDSTDRKLPLNLIVTFFGDLINDVCASGPDCLPMSLKTFENLKTITSPTISRAFLTTYDFIALINQKTKEDWSKEQLGKALGYIKKESSFRNLFGRRLDEVLDEVIKDANGGVEYALKGLIEDAEESRRLVVLKERNEENSNELKKLFYIPFPPTSGDVESIRGKLLDKWKSGLEKLFREEEMRQTQEQQEDDWVQGDPARLISHDLRNFINIEPVSLEPLPSAIGGPGFKPTLYVKRQLQLWKESKGRCSTDNIKKVGIDSKSDSQKLLQYVIDAVDVEKLADWINDIYGKGEDHIRKSPQKHIAIKIIRELFPEIKKRELHERVTPGTYKLLLLDTKSEISAGISYEDSPHYKAVVGPLYEMFERLKDQPPPGARGRQSGDEELRELAESHAVLGAAVGDLADD